MLETIVYRVALLFIMLILSTTSASADQQKATPDYKNLELSFKQRAIDLVKRMTLDEKVSQLINDAPAIPRLGVREYNWWNEGLHGVASIGDATVFPQAIGMAATWDEPLIFDIAEVIGTEFRAKHYANQHRFGGSGWFAGLTVWSPNINIFRDPRWGRGQETYGEDPFLSSRLGVAYVKGIQGNDPQYLKTVATPKHFAVHSGPEASRHRDDIHPSAKDLEETFLPPFRAAIAEGGAQSIMCAYNAVDGVPACASAALLSETLRKDWGFDGFVVSDCGALFDIYEPDNHGYSTSPEEGVKAAFDAGLDLVCGDANEADNIKRAVKKGLVSEDRIDQSLIRLFTARMRLGQFDPRSKVFPNITALDNDTAGHRALALTAAKKSLVLLKNKDNFLPIDPEKNRIAVIGPNADSVNALVGNYHGNPSQPVTLLTGLVERFGKGQVSYAKGTELLDPVQEKIPEESFCLDRRCKKQGLKAEFFEDQSLIDVINEEVVSSASLNWQGKVASGSVRWTGFLKTPEKGVYSFRYSGNGGYRIWVDKKLVIDAWGVDWRPVIASGSINLKKGKIYPIQIEAFQRGESGNEFLVWSKPSNTGVQQAIAIAKVADVIVFAGGLTAQVEGEEMPVPLPGFSGGDRTNLSLPLSQKQLLKQLYELKKPVVLVLMNGSALAVNEDDEHAMAIIEAWYPGGEGGQAIASLLAGDFSPSGRLPITFYRSVAQLPPFKDYSMQNRTYKYFEGEVLYPFGYGLSYSHFKYSDLNISPKRWRGKKPIRVSVSVKNTGAMDAEEVVQVYVSHPDHEGSAIRTLVGFQRVFIPAGESENVFFELDAEKLSLVNRDGERQIIPGEAVFWVGGGQPQSRRGLADASGLEGKLTLEFEKVF